MENHNNALIQEINESLGKSIFHIFPNYSGGISINGKSYPTSAMELSRPTGKHINRLLLKTFNAISKKGIIRTIGNACAPGLIFPQLVSGKGIEQFDSGSVKCQFIVANILGYAQYPDAVTIEAEPFMILPIRPNWNTYEDYLAEFSSKYRVRAQKVQSDSQSIEKRTLHTLPPNEWIAACGSLLFQSLQKKTVAVGKNLPELLHCYYKALGPNFKVFGYYLNNQLVGFITCIIDGKHLFAMHLGMNEHLDSNYKLYQRMLSDLVDLAISEKATILNFGRTGTEIKSTLGAIPVKNSFVIFTRSKWLLFLFKYYVNRLRKKNLYIVRKPFKQNNQIA